MHCIFTTFGKLSIDSVCKVTMRIFYIYNNIFLVPGQLSLTSLLFNKLSCSCGTGHTVPLMKASPWRQRCCSADCVHLLDKTFHFHYHSEFVTLVVEYKVLIYVYCDLLLLKDNDLLSNVLYSWKMNTFDPRLLVCFLKTHNCC